MISTVFDKIYADIEKCLEAFKIDINVYTELKGNDYPMVVVDEIRNDSFKKTTCRREGVDIVGISVDIYCKETEIENTVYSGRTLARDIMKYIDYICCNEYGLDRKMTAAPNVDDSIYRINLKYTSKISVSRGFIY